MFIKKEGFAASAVMWQDIVAELVANGFTLVSVDGVTGGVLSDTSFRFVLDPSVSIDPIVDAQPWRIQIELAEGRTSVSIATPNQITDTGDVYVNADLFPVGTLSTITAAQAEGTEVLQEFDIHTMGFHTDAILGRPMSEATEEDTDNQGGSAIEDPDTTSPAPLSYCLRISDHGIAFTSWTEGFDGDGNKFNWFVVQRMVSETFETYIDDKAPLVCVYSIGGGGSDSANELNPEGILQFIVREKDVHVPTEPRSASKHTADTEALLNPMQQVSITTQNRYLVRFIRNISTQRHMYPYEIDLIAYCSADVLSQSSEPVLTRGEPGNQKDLKYFAANANSKNNKGMRILIQQSSTPV